MRIETISRLAVLAAVAVSAGCAQPVSTREVALNADAYTARVLSPDALPASVRARLPAAGTQPMGFRTLRLTGTQRVVSMGNVAVDSEYELTFHNDRDDGTLRSIYIGRFNGLPVNYVLALNYRSLALLMHQGGGFKAAHVPPRWTVRSIEQWPGDVLANPPENARFTLESEGGWEGQRTGPRQTLACTSGADFPASRVLAQIPGQAIDLNCVETNESGVPVRRLKYAYLRQFGLAITTEMVTARSTATLVAKTFTVD
ncbi:hypothetical protein [Achromobacter insuavis]|uniref:hypothetical protein n=1 Tax=Achromobacter insuavis TaxID=1287735 RepID=UPI001F146AE5|nr:hypothetical protein [Achromobacter insuavis]